MAHCPFYSGPICSLCCSLDARCEDACKTGASFSAQWHMLLIWALPAALAKRMETRLAKYLGLVLLCGLIEAALLATIYVQMTSGAIAPAGAIAQTLENVFYLLLVVTAVAVWPFILAKESSRAAREETRQQTTMLLNEIEAHQRTDKELQKAKELAEARSLAKSKYLRGISHELRTPLNAVLGYAQLLESNAAIPGNLKHSVRVIRRSGEHLSSLVDGLLDISMIEAGRLQIYRDEVVLDEFLDQLVDMFRLQARDSGLDFSYEAPRNLPALVYVDEKRLRQILINLLSNAIRYTKAGKITFRIGYSSQVARFCIEDTGIGIAAKDLHRIFQPFERIESADHPARQGVGLGLTITKLLAEAMGGEIAVESTPGLGSRFTVRLMLSAVPPAQRRRPTVRASILGYDGPRRSILVADDDPHSVAVVEQALSALGFTVLSAENGKACLETATYERPDAILLDISMPGMDGWETARRLRASGLKKTPIIMISADARQENQREDPAHDAYLMKPLRLSTLLDCLQQMLGLEWRHGPSHPAQNPFDLAGLGVEQIPDEPDLARLRELGRIGHVRGILAKLDEISTTRPAAAPALSHLRRLAENCDLDGYRNSIEALGAHER